MKVNMVSVTHLILIFLSEGILLALASPSSSSSSSGGHNSVLGSPKYNSISTKESLLQRRLLKGREVIPAMSSNALPGEPSCDELRAMWRYYKRQSRAEYTNEIPQFGSNPFWDVMPAVLPPQQPRISSFGPLKGRAKSRLRLKNGKSPNIYGRVVYKQEKERGRNKPRPIQQVAELMGKTKSVPQAGAGVPKEPIVHLSPPPTPTKASSLQKIKEVFREERIREKSPAMRNNEDNSKAFGRILLSPPRGMDGRVANKPRELMTPFEKIRFGHADDILEDGSTKPNLNLMAKRRTIPLPMLKLRLQQQQQQNRQSRRDPDQDFDDHSLIWTSIDSLRAPQDYEDNNPNAPLTSQVNGGQGIDLMDNYLPIDNPADEQWLQFSTDDEERSDKAGDSSENNPIVDTPPTNPLLSLSLPSCPEVEGQGCKVNADCSCVGFGLYRCYVNQCQIISLLPPKGEERNVDESTSSSSSSFWHTSPLEKEELGVWEESPGHRHRRRVPTTSTSTSSNHKSPASNSFPNEKNSEIKSSSEEEKHHQEQQTKLQE